MKIFVLVAGTNEPSNSSALADAFIEGVKEASDADVQKRRLRDMTLQHFTLDCYDPAYPDEEDFCALQTLMQEADGFVIATPIWNFGVPAHLKNAIDRMGSFGLDETRSKGTLGGKPFFLIFTGGAPVPAWTGLMNKTTCFVAEGLRYFGATPIGTHFEPKCTKGRGVFGLVVDQRPESLAAVRQKGRAFAQVVREFATNGKLPVKKQIFRQLYGWGQSLMKRL